MTTRRIVGIVLAAAALTGLAACASGTAIHLSSPSPTKAATTATQTEQPPTPVTYPSDTPTPTTSHDYAAKFGVPYDVTGTDQNDNPIGATYTISTPVLDATQYDGSMTAKNGQFVSFNIHLKATTNGFDYNEFDFYVRGANGAHYLPSGGKDPTFNSGTAHLGEQVTGYVTFDAPRHGTLVYAPNGGGESVGEWVF